MTTQLTVPNSFLAETVRLRQEFEALLYIEDQEERFNTFSDWLEGMIALGDFLIEIASSIELWVAEQPEDPKYDDLVEKVQVWQRLLKKTEARILDLDNALDAVVPVQDVNEVFALLARLVKEMPSTK